MIAKSLSHTDSHSDKLTHKPRSSAQSGLTPCLPRPDTFAEQEANAELKVQLRELKEKIKQALAAQEAITGHMPKPAKKK